MTTKPVHKTITAENILFEQYLYTETAQKDHPNSRYILTGDIGGTNSNFGLFAMNDTRKPLLCASFHLKSKTVTDYHTVLRALLTHIKHSWGITIEKSCWGVAGFITHDRSRVQPTNLKIALDAQAIREGTSVDTLILINDFEAVGLGIDYIAPSDIITVNTGIPQPYAQKGCIGAGTGLGKTALLWNKRVQQYLPLASEGGHADCSAQTEEEYGLFTFMHAEKNRVCPISWEEVLSGDGISVIYRFLGTRKNYRVTAVSEEIRITGFKPDLISRYAHEDPRCFDTFVLYTTFYARCAKNFALDMLTLNGMYIAGGIAAKNIALFKSDYFRDEFYKCGKLHELLRNIPLFVIADYTISLYGAAAFMTLHDEGSI